MSVDKTTAASSSASYRFFERRTSITITPSDLRYIPIMLGLLMSVTIFEGYDATIFHLCTPYIAKTFHLDDLSIGVMASLVRLGGVFSFVVTMVADRVGRRPVVCATVLLYALFTLMTALSTGLVSFTVFQSLTQMFLWAELGVAVIIICEELPDQWRGRGVAFINLVGLLGVVAAGTLYGPIADSRFGWRGMYLVGIAPLLVVALLRRNIRETKRFLALSRSEVKVPIWQELTTNFKAAWRAFRGPYRYRLLLVAILCNSVGLISAPAVTFFSLYARRDRHWSAPEIGHTVVLAYVIGTLGHLSSGLMLDRVGRKFTTSLFYVLGAGAIFMLFRTTSHHSMTLALIATIFAFQGARTSTTTYSAELFPTEIRGTCYGLTVQMLGQISGLIAPVAIGALAQSFGGLGNAVSAFALGPLIGAIVVIVFAPETRGLTLEELAPSAH